MTRRHRGGAREYKKRSTAARQRFAPAPVTRTANPHENRELLALSEYNPHKIIQFCEANIAEWTRAPRLYQRLVSFGIPALDVQPLLKAFSSAMTSGKFRSNQYAFDNYGFRRLAYFNPEESTNSFTDIIFTSILYSWASDPANEQLLSKSVPLSTIQGIRRLSKACERRYPAEEFTAARRMKRRIIMHVGPTNSGKTYHALRALAAAPTGIYAGPLRLLAHEVWERLNLGLITPAGVEDNRTEPVKKDGVVVGNPQYSRLCNMLTGEEQKIVSDNASLVSCTVEMLSFHNKVDVAVVDEIQLIADDQRGPAWTSAVLGLCAKELHLCGEETAVPLVQALLSGTGDEIVVKRYERLTPLVPEDVPVKGDLSDIRKGDCIVAFSRSRIFALKNQVESKTGLRCAVVYGRLPPEVRSKQAELFNDPNSNYDIILGSDAIGMGLNLKIRRIIFQDVKKASGQGNFRYLTVSQVKQIAGRAGRYGVHDDSTPGYATSFNPYALKYIKKCLQEPFTPLQIAHIAPTGETHQAIIKNLPPNATMETLYNAHVYVSNIPPRFQYIRMNELRLICSVMDSLSGVLTLRDRLFLFLSPIPWREDQFCITFVSKLLSAYQGSYAVHVQACLNESGLLDNFNRVEEMMQGKDKGRPSYDTLTKLESLHKVLGLYAWLSYRRPVAFSSVAEVYELKPRVEKALNWVLSASSKLRHKDGAQPPQSRRVDYRMPFALQNLIDKHTQQSVAAAT